MPELVAQTRATPHDVAKIAGHLISLSPAFGSLSQLFTRQIYRFIEAREFWYQRKLLPGTVWKEFTSWLKNLDGRNGHSIKNNSIRTKIVYSDASDSGYGGYIVQRLGHTVARDTGIKHVGSQVEYMDYARYINERGGIHTLCYTQHKYKYS